MIYLFFFSYDVTYGLLGTCSVESEIRIEERILCGDLELDIWHCAYFL